MHDRNIPYIVQDEVKMSCFVSQIHRVADGLALGLDSVSSTLAIWLAVDNEFHDLHTIKLAVW